MALTRKGVPFVWTDQQQTAFEALKACIVRAPILGFPTEDGRFVLDTDASLFAVGGVLSHLQEEGEVVIAYANHGLRLSQRRYCTNQREMLAAVVMCTHFRSYLRGERGRNAGSLVFTVSNIVRGHSMPTRTACRDNVVSQCQRPDCPVSENNDEMEMVDQPFCSIRNRRVNGRRPSSGVVASALTEEFTADLPAGNTIDLIVESHSDETLTVLWGWIQSNSTPARTDCAELSPEWRCWSLQIGNLSIDTDGRLWRKRAPPAEGSQLVVPSKERQAMICRVQLARRPVIMI